jgi:replicative DNA helicase
MEWLLLKGVVEGKLDFSLVDKVDEFFFNDKVDRSLWHILRSYYSRGIRLSSWNDLLIAVMKENDGDGELVERIGWYTKQVVTVSDDMLLDTLKDIWKEKTLLDGFKKIEDRMLKNAGVKEVEKLFDSVYAKCKTDIFDVNAVQENALEGAVDRIVERSIDEKRGTELGSGISQLDAVLKGGFRKGSLVIWVGATSVGKTMMLIYQSVMSILQGMNVLFVSLEDSKDIVLERFDKLVFGNVSGDLYKVKDRIEWLNKIGGNISVFYKSRMSIKELITLVEERKTKVDVLVVDYGDLLSGDGKGREDWIEQGEVFERLMQLADKHNMWVITASQANRDAVDKKLVSLNSIGRSFRKVQVADYVIALSQTKEEEQEDMMRLVILKNKFGVRRHQIAVKVFREHSFFRDA